MLVDLEFDYVATTSVLEFYSETKMQELQQWIQKLDKSTYVPKNLSNKQLVLFYNACNGNMDNTKICIEKYYICRNNAPEIFNRRVFKSEDLKIISKLTELFSFPDKSNDGSEIICYRLREFDYTNFNFEASCKLLLMVIDLSLYKRGPQNSYLFVLDMEGVQLGHVLKINPLIMKKILQYIQEAIQIRIKGIHVINANSLWDKVMTLSKPFLKKELYDVMKFHKKGENLANVFEKIIPISSFPIDYGGSQPECQLLHKQTMEQLKTTEAYFKNEEEQRTAALPDHRGENTLVGTFKKLDID